MKRIKGLLFILLCSALLITSCAKKDTLTKPAAETHSIDEYMDSEDLDSEFDENTSVSILLNGESAKSSSNAVEISKGKITLTKAATYMISGTLDDGMIIVDAGEKDKVRIVFNGADITSKTSAALYVLEADKVTVTSAEGSENRVANGGSFTAIDDNNIDAAIFSKKDLVLNGKGSLTVESPAGHGISAKDELGIAEGNYTVNAGLHCFDVNDSVVVYSGNFELTAGKDGIHSENNEAENYGFIYIENGGFKISSTGDGISASNYLQIKNGSFEIESGGGSANAVNKSYDDWGYGYSDKNYSKTSASTSSDSAKGLKSGDWMHISSGEFNLNCQDDSVHSASAMTIAGGNYNISCGDDGFHSDTELNITGGNINITKCYEGIEAESVSINGGEIALIASDDGINAAGGKDYSGYGGQNRYNTLGNGSITINGGTLNITANGDGVDSNGSLEVNGGNIYIDGPTVGDTSTLDYETSGCIKGGLFIGTGTAGMNMCFDSNSTQGVIMTALSGNTGDEIVLYDSLDNVLMTHTAKQDYNCVILSSPDICKGEVYSLKNGDNVTSITMDSLIYNKVASNGFSGMGPGGGGMRGPGF